MAKPERALPVYLQNLKSAENLGEEILADQQQIVELDVRRQSNRQAIRAVMKEKETDKMWCMMGEEFLKVEKTTLEEWLQNDQRVIDEEIDKIRAGLKDKVTALKVLEGKTPPQGFGLKPINKYDLSSISQLANSKERYV